MQVGVIFDAWMEAFCSKALTFSGHFFEMIIHYLSVGGAVFFFFFAQQGQSVSNVGADSPDPLCQCLAAVGCAKNADGRV